MVKVALLVDIEQEWFSPKSPYSLGENKDYRKRIKQLVDILRKNKIPIVFTQHIEPKGEPAFHKGKESDRIGSCRNNDKPLCQKHSCRRLGQGIQDHGCNRLLLVSFRKNRQGSL